MSISLASMACLSVLVVHSYQQIVLGMQYALVASHDSRWSAVQLHLALLLTYLLTVQGNILNLLCVAHSGKSDLDLGADGRNSPCLEIWLPLASRHSKLESSPSPMENARRANLKKDSPGRAILRTNPACDSESAGNHFKAELVLKRARNKTDNRLRPANVGAFSRHQFARKRPPRRLAVKTCLQNALHRHQKTNVTGFAKGKR